jgi:hypothetical protein
MDWMRQLQRFGYTVDGQFYFSKISALDAAGGDIDRVHLYFLDNEWKHVDWTKEPPQSWQELIDLRCRQLRDSYRSISLFFSGGFDSMTILNGFLRNHLPLDELIIWDRAWLPECQIEIQYAKQVAEQIKKNHWPNLKITYQRKEVDTIAKFYETLGDKWIEHPGEHFAMQKNIRDWEFETMREVLGRHHATGHILLEGRDKPRVNLRDGRWYAMMNDKLLKFCMGNTAEQFYYSPDFPELHVKQCFMAIDWMEKTFDITHEMVHQIQSFKLGPEVYERYNVEGIGRDPVACSSASYGLIKTLDHGGILSKDSLKAGQQIIQAFPKSYNLWKRGIDEIKTVFYKAWNHDANELQTVVSQQHFMKDFTPKSVLA